MIFTKSNIVIGLLTLAIILVNSGCSESDRAKGASAEVTKIEVSAWGPHQSAAGEKFNVQPNGESAMWFTSAWTGNSENVEVWFGDQKLGNIGVTSGTGISATIPPSLLSMPKTVSVRLVNKLTGQIVDVGVFEITAAK